MTEAALPAKQQPPPYHRTTALLVGLASFLFYLFQYAPTADATILGNDAVYYSLSLESNDVERILDAHHPLFHVVSWGICTLLSSLAPGLEMPGLWAVKITSALGGAAALMALVLLARPIAGWAVTLLLVLLLGSSAGMRLYASVGETYLPAYATGLALCLYLLGRWRQRRLANLRWCILATTLAIAWRQDSVFLVPFVALVLGFDPALRIGRKQRVISYLTWTAIGSVAVYVACYGLYWGVSEDPRSPTAWLLHLAVEGDWGNWGGVSILVALRRSLWVTAYSWDYGTFPTWAGRDPLGIPAFVPWIALALPWAVALALGWKGKLRITSIFLCGFVLPRLLFVTWWQHGNSEYHFGHWFPLVALLVLLAADVRPRGLVVTALALALLWTGWSNERSLCAELRGKEFQAVAKQCAQWDAEGRAVKITGQFIGHALDRFGGVPHETLQYTPSEEIGAWVREQVAALRSAPRGVVIVRQTIVPRLLGTAQEPIEHVLALGQWLLLEEIPFQLHPPGSAPEHMWACIIEPPPGR